MLDRWNQSTIPITDFFELCHGPPDREWLIEGWLPTGLAGVLGGCADEGQTAIAAQLSAGLATGDPEWLPGAGGDLHLSVDSPAPVVIAGDHLTKKRLMDDSPAFRRAASESGRVPFFEAGGRWPLWAEFDESGIRRTEEVMDSGHELRDLTAKLGTKLLVVDCAEAAFRAPAEWGKPSGDNPQQVGERRFLIDWSAWAKDAGCTVIFLSAGRSIETSWWIDAPRFAWTFDYRTEGVSFRPFEPMQASLNLAKSNYSRPGAAVDLAWDTERRLWTAS